MSTVPPDTPTPASPDASVVGKIEVPVTPEMVAMLKQLTDASKITRTLAKPLWVATAAIVTAVFGGGMWWQQQSSYAQTGSPALIQFRKDIENQRSQDQKNQEQINNKLTEISTRLAAIQEQHEKRISNIENRR